MFVKICGTTSEADALLAVAMGADAVGFIFAPSARQVSPAKVADIVKRLPTEVVTVGVFVDETPERVVATVARVGLRGAQLHGHEGPEATRWVAERVPFTIKAFPAGSRQVAEAGEYGAHAVLLDAPTPGSGQVFDWSLAEGAMTGQRLILAGGLHAGNVAEAIAQVRPWGVDAASGVESEPGKKDPHRLREFIAAAKAADVPRYEGRGDAPYDWQEEG